MQIFLLISLVIAILAIVFALQNAVPVTLAFLVWKIDSSLAVVLLVALGGAWHSVRAAEERSVRR